MASYREGNGNPLQYSWLENPMDGGAWCAAVHGVTKSQTRMAENDEKLNNLLMRVKEESKKPGLKLNIHKTKIMASNSITSWQIHGEKVVNRKQW